MPQLMALTADHQNWQQSYQCVNFLLKEGAAILWATDRFSAITVSGEAKTLDRGTFLITDMLSKTLFNWLHHAAQRFEVEFVKLESVQGFAGLPLKPLRIAMYGGGGAPFNHARIFAELGFFVDFISPQEIKQDNLAEFDVFVMPGGGGIAMKGQLDPLGDKGCQMIADFVRQGGMYMGSCAGAFDAALVSDSFVAMCPQQRHLQLINAAVWNRNDTEWVGLDSPGVGILESQNLRPDHPVMFGMPERFRITHYNGPLFEYQPGTLADASDSIGLSAVTGFTEEFTPAEYFLRFAEYDDTLAQETSLIGKAAREGRFNIVSGYNGLGRVVLFGSHPEFGYNLAMDEWDAPARMLANSAFWQAGHVKEARSMLRKPVQGIPHSYPLGSGLSIVGAHCAAITSAVEELLKQDASGAAWLEDVLAMSTFGLEGREIWKQNLDEFATVTHHLRQTLEQAKSAVSEAESLMDGLSATGTDKAIRLADTIQDALLGLEEALHYRTPAEWNQDFGYEGVLQMLERTETMLRKAQENFTIRLVPTANPYEHFFSSPYQLVVGSYLAALGVYANSWLLLQVHNVRINELIFKGQSLLEIA